MQLTPVSTTPNLPRAAAVLISQALGQTAGTIALLYLALTIGCGTTTSEPPPERVLPFVTIAAPSIAARDNATYRWRQVSGPTVEIVGQTSAEARFVSPNVDEDADLGFVVDVNEGQGVSNSYAVTVRVPAATAALGNRPPLARAEEFKTARVGEFVILNAGNSYDPDGDSLTYLWTQVAPVYSSDTQAAPAIQVPLSNVTSASAGFLATEAGTLLFQVAVSDGAFSVSHTMAVAVLAAMPGDPCSSISCPAGHECRAGVCVEVRATGCRSGDECDDGLFCTATDTCEAGECVGRGDACPGADCDEVNNRCIARPSPCTSDLDCPEGMVCRIDDGACTVSHVPACSLPLAFSTETFSTGGEYPFGITLADMNNDGVLDMLIANRSTGSTSANTGTRTNLAILYGQGNARVGPPRTYYSGWGAGRVAAGDLDKDGVNDAVVANFYDGSVTIFYGTPAGVFSESRTRTETLGGFPQDVALADFNLDGLLDIAVANAPKGSVSILTMSEVAAPPSVRTLPVSSNSRGPDQFFVTDIDFSDGPNGIVVADLDNDGCLDIVTAISYANSIAVMAGFCDGSFSPPTSISAGDDPRGLAYGDFDSNGNGDLAVAIRWSAGDTLTALFGDGGGDFPTRARSGDYGQRGEGAAAGDLNGDGIDDIVAALPNDASVLILLSKGDGSFETSQHAAGTAPVLVALGDLDGDGDSDIVVTNHVRAGTVTVLRNRCGE
ncbi:MAG: hypothetical protein A49_17130 [Methyloceanibacter sp.]|nr:MAG: hypothetical protein A49_17130 [Methyloceanibacter sp.]